MADRSEAEPSLLLETVECSPAEEGKLAVRLHGRWHDRRRTTDARPILVVDVDGRRHRFPAIPTPRLARIGRPGSWAANFALPAWLGPRLAGHTMLSLGDLEVEVHGFLPAGNGAEPSHGKEQPKGEVVAASGPEDSAPAEAVSAPGDVLGGEGHELREGSASDDVTAVLRAELQERAAAQARIRGELADARAELEARVANQERLRATQEQLRAELEQLSALVVEQDKRRAEVADRADVLAAELEDALAQVGDVVAAREDLMAEREVLVQEVATLRAAVAAGIVTSDAATAEAEGLREELERLGAELAQVREALGSRDAGVDEAQALLVEARALTASLRDS